MNQRERGQARELDGFVSVKTAAEILGVSKEAVTARIRRGTLPAVVVGRRADGRVLLFMIPRTALETYHRAGRPRGQRFVPPHEVDASPPGTGFLEEAAAALPGELGVSGDDIALLDTMRLEDWLRRLDDGGDPSA